MKKLISLLLILCLLLCGCSRSDSDKSDDDNSDLNTQLLSTDFPTEPKASETNPDANTCITLQGGTAVIDGSGAEVNGSTLTISKAGTYALSGSFNGQLIVDVSQDSKVVLIFNGVKIHCADSAAVFVKQSPKHTKIETVKGSINLLIDGSTYSDFTPTDELDAPTAALFSMDDLKLDGKGELYITGNYNKGIFTKDDLEIDGGAIYVAAVDDGVRGKDSIVMTDGSLSIVAGGDGLRTSNDTDTDKGYIHISGGNIAVKAEQDAIQAITDLSISGGSFDLISGGGSANASYSSDNNWGNWGGGDGIPQGGRPGDQGGMGGHGGPMGNKPMSAKLSDSVSAVTSSDDTESASAKAIKADGAISISGGSFSIDCSDDAVHSNTTVNISGGTFTISSGDDGIHADDTMNISGGQISIVVCYEGFEATTLNISGGEHNIAAKDDGLNAAGGNDGSAMGGRPGQNSFEGTYGIINLTGGSVCIVAEGDGVDSNGDIAMKGGTLLVYGPESAGNGCLDYQNTFVLSGGLLLACGPQGMAQTATGSGQEVLAFTCGNIAADTLVSIQDTKGEIITFCSPKSFSFCVFSSPKLKSGETYTVYTGGSSNADMENYVYSNGGYSGGSSLGSLTLK